MIFKGFPVEGIELLKDIELNNNKEWFEANRDRHEEFIIKPNRAFIEELGEHLQVLVPTIHAIPKTNKSMFKIYRDSRFHPTEPIKTKIGIIFWQGASHRMQSSSFYMHYQSDEVFFATGIRNFKPPLLKVYREYISDDYRRKTLHEILEKLKSKGYSLPEPRYKRYPNGWNENMPMAYLSLFGAIYSYTSMKPNKIFYSSKIINMSFDIYSDMLELQKWLYELTLYQNSKVDTHDI